MTTDPDPDPDPPSIATSVLLPATEGQTGYYDVVEVDQPGPDVTWSVVSGTLPDGLSLDPATGEITGDLAPDGRPRRSPCRPSTRPAAPTGPTSPWTSIPRPSSPPPRSPRLGRRGRLLPGAGGHRGRPRPDLVGHGVLPDDLTLDPTTGIISGDVAAGAATETFAVAVTDANGFTDSETLTLDVTRTFVQEKTATHTAGNASRFTVTMNSAVTAGTRSSSPSPRPAPPPPAAPSPRRSPGPPGTVTPSPRRWPPGARPTATPRCGR